MKYLPIVCLYFFLSSCSSSENFNRGYVISKSQVENEKEALPSEEPDIN